MTDNLQEEIENKIIDIIALEARGRLVAFKPEGLSTALVIEKKGDYKSKAIVFDIYSINESSGPGAEDEINRLLPRQKIVAKDNFYLLFVCFDIVSQDLKENFWIVPSLKLQGLKPDSGLSQFLVERKEFVNFIMKAL